MNDIFAHCSSLKELNISNFNVDKVDFATCILYECSSLIDLYLSELNVKKIKQWNYFDENFKNLNLKII